MKFLGLDLGSRTCGVSISDSLGMLARTHSTIRFEDDDYDFAAQEVLKIVKEEKIEKVILGYPKHMNGDIGERGKISEMFKEKLVGVEVILWDERLTTMMSNRIMLENNTSRSKRKQKKDEHAALIILQSYLDRR